MAEVSIVFPHQLFNNHPSLQKDRVVYIVEEWLFFNQFNFHKQKIILHRSSMKKYADYLAGEKYTVEYIEASNKL